MLSCLFLTISTCLTIGTGELVKGNSIEQLREKSNQVLEVAATEFDLQSFSILDEYNADLQDNDIYLSLLDTMINLNFVQDDLRSELEILENNYLVDESFQTNFSFDSLRNNSLFNNGSYDNSFALEFVKAIHSTTSFNDIINIDDDILEIYKSIESKNTTLEDEEENIANEIIDNAEKEKEGQLELIPLIQNHGNNKLSIKINERINDKIFIGLDFTSETCISIYNIISNWLNNKAALATTGAFLTLFSSVVTLLKTSYYGTLLYETIVSLISSVWPAFCEFLMTTGVLGVIISAVVLTTILCTALIIAKVFFAGSKQLGYRVGFIRYGFLNWGTLNEEY